MGWGQCGGQVESRDCKVESGSWKVESGGRQTASGREKGTRGKLKVSFSFRFGRSLLGGQKKAGELCGRETVCGQR